MEVALIIGALVLVCAYAAFEAWGDFEHIQAHVRIDHAEGWMVRAFVVGYMWVVLSFKIGCDAVPGAIGSAFLFSTVFRYCLNKMRGKDWRYLSPSAWYDYAFLMMTGAWEWKQPRWTWSNWQGFIRQAHWTNYKLNPPYVLQVHRAGAIAYLCEAAITIACLFCMNG